jgi:hypothetical protein
MFDVDRSTIMGRSLFDIARGEWNVVSLREQLMSLLTDRTVLQGYEIELEAGGARRRFSINARRLDLQDGEGDRIVLAIEGPRLERGPL